MQANKQLTTNDLQQIESKLMTLHKQVLEMEKGQEELALKGAPAMDGQVELDGSREADEAVRTGLIEQELAELSDIEDALQKLKVGKYGVCDECGDEIANKRLMARPEARFCLRCQEELEADIHQKRKPHVDSDFSVFTRNKTRE